MRCPRCSTENPAQANFCMACGTVLGYRCANCQTKLPATARFCMACGRAVERTTPYDEERHRRLAAAVPPVLAQKMRSARLSGERKVVTALFADVVGSTALAEKMDAEDWTGVMNEAFERMSPAIYRYEGTIARLLGDSMLAFFGAPVAHEDDPIRAVHAALELLEAIRIYGAEMAALHGIDFQVRVGINTGPVVVGEVGSDLKYEYTAMGDAINLAARLQGAAHPMTTLISEDTYRIIAPLFDCLDRGPRALRGKSEAVSVYEVQGVRAQPAPLRGIAGLSSPMVGRAAPLADLHRLTESIAQGTGHLALILGDPGLGKSRLIAEWQATSPALRDGRPIQWLHGACLSYGQNLAYHLIIDLLRSLIGLSHAANETETRAALHAFTDALLGANNDLYPYLAHLLSLRLNERWQPLFQGMDPQTLHSRYFLSLRRLLLALAERGPLVVVLEDIHWADAASVELVTLLLPLVQESPLVLCCALRAYQDTAGWRVVEAARTDYADRLLDLPLAPLSEADSRQLVANLLEIEDLSTLVRDAILTRAEGNPFFVEEVIRMLIDRGAILRQGNTWVAGKSIEADEIPDSLQSLIQARIDRLPEAVKHTLRVAAVIGRQFAVRVLEQVLSEQDETV